jgi:hypothetical protein
MWSLGTEAAGLLPKSRGSSSRPIANAAEPDMAAYASPQRSAGGRDA